MPCGTWAADSCLRRLGSLSARDVCGLVRALLDGFADWAGRSTPSHIHSPLARCELIGTRWSVGRREGISVCCSRDVARETEGISAWSLDVAREPDGISARRWCRETDCISSCRLRDAVREVREASGSFLDRCDERCATRRGRSLRQAHPSNPSRANPRRSVRQHHPFAKGPTPLSGSARSSTQPRRSNQRVSTPLSPATIKTSAPRAANNPTVTTPTIWLIVRSIDTGSVIRRSCTSRM